MPSTAARQCIIDAVQEGVLEAAAFWSHMSGEWLWIAPEHFLSNTIARKVHEALCSSSGGWVTLEWPVTKTVEGALVKPLRGRPHTRLRKGGRSDIVVFRKDGRPRGAIEVKHRYRSFTTTLKSDAERLIQLVRMRSKGSTVPLGILCLYLEVGDPTVRYTDAKDRWWKTAKRIAREAKEHLAGHDNKDGISLKCQCSEPVVNQGGAYGSICLVYWHAKRRVIRKD